MAVLQRPRLHLQHQELAVALVAAVLAVKQGTGVLVAAVLAAEVAATVSPAAVGCVLIRGTVWSFVC